MRRRYDTATEADKARQPPVVFDETPSIDSTTGNSTPEHTGLPPPDSTRGGRKCEGRRGDGARVDGSVN